MAVYQLHEKIPQPYDACVKWGKAAQISVCNDADFRRLKFGRPDYSARFFIKQPYSTGLNFKIAARDWHTARAARGHLFFL